MGKINKNKIYAYLFVIGSLAVFLFMLLALALADLRVPRNITRDEVLNHESTLKNFDTRDPYITKVPKLEDMITVPIMDNGDPVLGNAEAPTKVVIYADYDCKFCGEQLRILQNYQSKNPGRISLIWKDYPDTDTESLSYLAAVAARCAGEQGKFWEYNEALFANQNELKEEDFVVIAGKIGMKTGDWQACISSGANNKQIDNNIYEANALEIPGVPFIFVNDRGYLGGVEESVLDSLK